MVRARLLVLALTVVAALASLAVGCDENRWGSRCTSNGDCGSGLVCKRVSNADSTNVTGLCLYEEEVVRCGPGTVQEGGQCVLDPDLPPEVTCGPGTVDNGNGSCVAAEPDAGADSGVDAGVDAR